MVVSNKIKDNIEKQFKKYNGEVRFEKDTYNISDLPVARIKVDIQGTTGIRKVGRLTQQVFKKLKTSIAYIYIHNREDEEVAVLTDEGEWCCI